MRNRNKLSSPDSRPELAGRQLAILALGAIGVKYEQGSNAHAPEALQAMPEELSTEPTEHVSVE